jgi:hypothetical protein
MALVIITSRSFADGGFDGRAGNGVVEQPQNHIAVAQSGTRKQNDLKQFPVIGCQQHHLNNAWVKMPFPI